jgi:hypothetical protein
LPRHPPVFPSMPYFLEFSPGYGLHQGYLPGRARIARMHQDALLESAPVS